MRTSDSATRRSPRPWREQMLHVLLVVVLVVVLAVQAVMRAVWAW
jgi:hypothetical protein